MRERLSRLGLYLNTVRFMRPDQASYFVYRMLHPTSAPAGRRDSPRRRGELGLMAYPRPARQVWTGRGFRFLNIPKEIDPRDAGWTPAGVPKLWRYHLQYFDYAIDPSVPREVLGSLIEDWILHHPVGTPDGWEPYPISLRSVNWIKVFAAEGALRLTPRPEWLEVLYDHALWLERNLERDVLVNHYLANAKALCFCGIYFSGRDADRWLAAGLRILREQAEEQILPDGGHFERTMMYHSIVLEDLLDVVQLFRACGGVVDAAITRDLATKAASAASYLSDLRHPDGEIALFGDSALGEAKSPAELLAYGTRVLGGEPAHATGAAGDAPELSARRDSGFFILRDRGDVMVIDCGEVGPSYQAGHGHCDLLSYELSLGGRRVIVDTGILDYEDSPTRAYARSTRAHNTVRVDGKDQSEMWSVFRVARRAHPLYARLDRLGDTGAAFEGAHDGFARLAGGVVHRRSITYRRGQGTAVREWEVIDHVEGAGEHRAESFVHFHPDLMLELRGQETLVRDKRTGAPVARVAVTAGVATRVETGWYYPEFGRSIEKAVLCLTRSGVAPLSIGYRITPA